MSNVVCGPEMVERPLVYVLEQIAPSAIAILRQSCDVVEPGDPGKDRWPDDAHGIIVRTSKITADLLEAASKLKVVGKHGVGVDNIDLDAARARGVAVISTPGANANAVAELAVGMALSVARRISLLDRVLREGTLSGTPPQGFELTGRTVGVVGMGSVGRRTAALFRNAFGAPLLAFDPFAPDGAFAEVGAERYTSLDAMLSQIDLLTLHIPLTPDTANLIDGRRLDLMRRDAILLNLSRGGIVDETALHGALSEGRIAGAASDVFVEEPPRPDHPLLSLGNFVATPHTGAATAESMERMGMEVVAGVVAFLSGGTPRHRVV
jgi:D-3-phosphoglycerate dehydrogenase